LFLVPLASRPTTEKVVSRPLLTAKLSHLSPLFSFQGSPDGRGDALGRPPRMTPVFYQMAEWMSRVSANICLQNVPSCAALSRRQGEV
jgi:hypothetical protein